MLTTDPPTSTTATATTPISTSTAIVPTMPAAAAAAGNANGINPKLLHLVQKIVSHAQTTTTSTATTPKKPTLEYVIHCLRTQNVEYQRKNMDRLKKQVETALTYVLKNQQEQAANSNKKSQTPFNSPAGGELGKRSRSKQKQNASSSEQKEEEQQQEEEISSEEEADRLYDAQREEIVDNSALNASLRKRYEKLQKERDAAAAAEAAAVAAAAATKLAEENANNKLLEEANNSNAGESTNNKSRKRKLSERRKSKSSSSKRAQLGNDNFMDGDDDDKASLLRPVPRPVERYSDLGGMDHVMKQIRELVEYPLVRPELYAHLGVGPPRGILLQGPPGTG